MMRRKTYAVGVVEDDEAKKDSRYQCSADGCPLRATIFDSIVGPPSHGRCRYHDRLDPKHWPKLTKLVNSAPFRRDLMEGGFKSLGLQWLEDTTPAERELLEERSGMQEF